MVTIEKMTAKQLFARPDWGRFESEYLAMVYPEMAGPGVLRSYYEQCTDAGTATMLIASDGGRTLGLACFFVAVSPHTGVKTCMVDALYTSELAPPSTGAQLMLALRKSARAAGAAVVLFSAQTGSDFDRMLAKLKSARHAQNIYIVVA